LDVTQPAGSSMGQGSVSSHLPQEDAFSSHLLNKNKLQDILHFPFTYWYPPSRPPPAFALWACPTLLVCPGDSHC